MEGYGDILREPQGLLLVRVQDHIPIMPGSNPVNSNLCRYPYIYKTKIKKMVREMLDSGIIKYSTSPYASLVLLVKKKDNTWRLYVDYKALNNITIKNNFPIPIVEELRDEVKGSNMYTKLNLRSGYHQIKVKDEDTKKTNFKTHQGHYEFLVMPFTLSNTPTRF